MPPELDREDFEDLVVLTGLASREQLDDLLGELLVTAYPTLRCQNS